VTHGVPGTTTTPGHALGVYDFPVREHIGSAVLYIIRRGIKEAIEQKADAVILDMKTPGGSLGTTLEIMEAIAKFPGTTITYVNNEAMSAGAFISATTEEIWFAPSGIIGAAAPVSMGGQDVEATMRQKIVSYLKARIRATSEGKGYRGEVISAMIDADYQLKIGDVVIKDKGELLSLTASEAAKKYGEPPKTLLSAGTANDIDDLIAQRFGPGRRTVTTLEVTWSESLAVWLNAISTVLLGVGLLALYIEFKTPGFGVFGVIGIICLAIVFLSSYVAG
jgi:membrane-bound serine protease (ClpP class)